MAIATYKLTPHRIQIKQMDDRIGYANLFIDDKEIHRVYSVNFQIVANEIPETTIKLLGAPDLDADALVYFGFTPETVETATAVFRSALINDKTLYDGLCASILSAIEDISAEPDGMQDKALAAHIADRIIGKD